jgi:hypothetical protein
MADRAGFPSGFGGAGAVERGGARGGRGGRGGRGFI